MDRFDVLLGFPVAVYSDEYTASMRKKQKPMETKPSRVPHFIVARKYMEKQLVCLGLVPADLLACLLRKQQVAKLKDQIEVLKDQ